eukprot:359018-Chlamydomonas_euryale.AAC.4
MDRGPGMLSDVSLSPIGSKHVCCNYKPVRLLRQTCLPATTNLVVAKRLTAEFLDISAQRVQRVPSSSTKRNKADADWSVGHGPRCATQVATDAADAAELAYDKFADRELRQRDRSLADEGVSALPSALSGPQTAGGSRGTKSAAGSAPPLPPEARLPVSDAVLQQRPYFDTVAAAYVVGLLTAFGANAVTHMGQPALLYIVPATLGAVVARGLSRDELYRVWQYTDVPTYGMPAELLKKADEHDKEQAKKM